jgi:membrane protein YqaA with SNARE-associated domain
MLDHIWTWLIVGLLSVLFNLTPILAPPTWAMLAYFHVQQDMPFLPAVIAGAVGSTIGRVLLALASRRFGARLIPARRQADVEKAVTRIRDEKRLNIALLGLFAVGPIPKSLLFMAAGMARIPLAPGAIVYCLARAAIYGVALTATSQAASSLSEIITSPVGGPLLIATQVASVAGVFLLFRVDLPRLVTRTRRSARWVVRRVAPSQA